MPARLKVVAEVIERNRADLALPGVLSIRPGWKFTGGWPVGPPTPAIVVTVVTKTSQPPARRLPTTLEGVTIDVRQASPRKRQTVGHPDEDPPATRSLDTTGTDPATGAVPQFADETTPAGAAVPPALPQTFADAAAGKPQIPYSPADVPLDPVTGTITVQASASPDAGWPVLKAFLGSVQQTLTIGLYDWTSKHILDTVTADLADKTVNLVLDHPSRNATADQSDEDTVTALKTSLGSGLTQAWALERSDPLAAAWQFPSAYHIKVAVADSRRVWLSSGNWNNSNQPDIDPVTIPGDTDAARSGDRDWHVVIDSPDLAATFEAYLANDLTVALAHQQNPAAATVELAAEAREPAIVNPTAQTPPFTQFWAPARVTEQMTITPLLTPDPGGYATAVQALIESATATLYMQFQYIELPKDPTTAPAAFTSLIAAVVARQQAGVDVRIIMSEYEVQGYLEKLMTAGLDVATGVRIQNNVHNKGIVVDTTTVLVSSQNWSGAGTTTNRDAGVILTNPTLASYFQTIFLHDWEHLAGTTAAED